MSIISRARRQGSSPLLCYWSNAKDWPYHTRLTPTFTLIFLIWMAIKKICCHAAGSRIWLPARSPTPCSALLLVSWESYMTPSWPKFTKIPPETSGYSYFLIDKSPKRTFFIILKHFVRNRSTVGKKIFLLQAILSCVCSKFWES
jgi:hypothetical protein